jgi:hypothetical protein
MLSTIVWAQLHVLLSYCSKSTANCLQKCHASLFSGTVKEAPSRMPSLATFFLIRGSVLARRRVPDVMIQRAFLSFAKERPHAP